jgi:hypothetical protein
MLCEHAPAVGLDLDLPKRFDSGARESEIETADARETTPLS